MNTGQEMSASRMERYKEYVAPAQCDNCNAVCNAGGRSYVWVYYPAGAKAQAEAQGYCSEKCREEWRARNVEKAMTQDKADAVIAIIMDAQASRNSLTSYNRINRACRTLGLTNGETERVLYQLEYHNSDGHPRGWLADAISRKKADKRGHSEPEET